MNYKKYFDPEPVEIFDQDKRKLNQYGDIRDGSIYVYTDEIILGINVALATGRPILLRGVPGSGKSTLASSIARNLGWCYYEQVISSQTQAIDLLWYFDSLRRLNDATAKCLKEDFEYLSPGILWKAFDPTSAQTIGGKKEPLPAQPQDNNCSRAVILLDEIDKADPDVPNDLLVPIGSLEFNVEMLNNLIVKANQPPLFIFTTNEERVLPKAFLRRCIVMELPEPDKDRLIKIAAAHFGNQHQTLYEKIADYTINTSKELKPGQRISGPSTAEFLDAVQTSLELDLTPDSEIWDQISNLTLIKLRNKWLG